MENSVQIDVKEIINNTVVCNLYADGRCVRVIMGKDDYDTLCRDKFFIRSGQNRDSAGVINTTSEYLRTQQ